VKLLRKVPLGVAAPFIVAIALALVAVAMVGSGDDQFSKPAEAAPAPDLSRCLDVPRELRDRIASSLKPGVRLGPMQAVKSKGTDSYFGDVYYLAAALDGRRLQTIGTWSVFRSLGHDSGLIWVADDQTAKVSTAGVDVPLKTVGSLPDDGWNEAMDCLEAAG
jgi:hypothetical protein